MQRLLLMGTDGGVLADRVSPFGSGLASAAAAWNTPFKQIRASLAFFMALGLR